MLLGLAGVLQSGFPQTSHQFPEQKDGSHNGRSGNEGESGNHVFQTHRFELATTRAIDLKDNWCDWDAVVANAGWSCSPLSLEATDGEFCSVGQTPSSG